MGVTKPRAGLFPLALLLLAACGGKEPATGEADDIVVAAHPELWPRIQARVKARLEPSQITSGNLKSFEVSYLDPTTPEWEQQRLARQILLIGTAADPWMEPVLDEPPPTPPLILEDSDVWAEGQSVTAVLLPEGDARAAVREQLDSLRNLYEQRYREYVVERLFAEGTNQAQADTLLEQFGFAVLAPSSWVSNGDGDVFVFRAPEDDSSNVIRQVTVTWRSPIPQGIQGDGLLAWRQLLAAEHFGIRQSVTLGNVDASQTTHRGNVAYQLLGNWRNPQSGGPTRGPFMMRAIICPSQDRMYLVDGWLWAPDQEQHEYLVQLESILNSFRCGSARASQPNE